MFETPNFIYHQMPLFWWCLAAAFFLLGMLYAAVTWRSSKRQLRRAERQQLQLINERHRALADRQRQYELGNQRLLAANQVPTTPKPAVRNQDVSPNGNSPASSNPSAKAAQPLSRVVSSPYASSTGAATNGNPLAALFSETYASSGNGRATDEPPPNEPRHKTSHVRPNPWTDYR